MERTWYVVDATGQTLGRLATQIASILRGKNKPQYTPYEDVGDFVIVINAEKVNVTASSIRRSTTGIPAIRAVFGRSVCAGSSSCTWIG